MTYLRFVLVVAAFGACSGNKKCEQVADFYEKRCIAEATQPILIDGKPTGQLQSADEAKKDCAKAREHSVSVCKDTPDDVLACDLSQAKDEASWKADKKCQDILSAHYKKTHPNEK